jgi:DNA-binding SARP family transcriptional activator
MTLVATPDVRPSELRLLGGFALRVEGRPVDLQPAAQRLLALLALAGAAVERSYAAFRLWPDTDEERAKANLRSTVWRLRRAPGELVRATKTHIGLHREVWVDVSEDLEDAEPDPTRHFELLPDWYDDWLVTERERIRQLHLHAMERRTERLIESGRTDEAIQLGLRASALEPLRESPQRLVIRCHLAEGNLIEAIRHYDRYADLLACELGAAPSDGMRHLLSHPSMRSVAAAAS